MKRKAEASSDEVNIKNKRNKLNEKCPCIADIDAYFEDISEAEIITQLQNNVIDLNMIDDKNITLFMYSANKGYFDLFTYLNSNSDTKKDILTKDGETIIHCAAIGGNKGILSILLENIIDIEATDIHDSTPLHVAVAGNCIEVVNLLLEHDANIEAADKNGYTPLHIAGFKSYIEVIKMLIEYNANIEATNKNGYTPLHLAAGEGWVEAVKLFLEQNANIEATDKSGCTPLHVAASEGKKEITELLIKNGAKTTDLFNKILFPPEMVLQDRISMLKFLFKLGISVDFNLYIINLEDGNIAQELKDIVNDLFLVDQIKNQVKSKLPGATNMCQDLIAQRLEILLKQEGLKIDYTNYKEYIENIDDAKLNLEIKQAIIKFITKHQENLSVFATALLTDCFNEEIFPIEGYSTCGEKSKDFYLSIAEDLGIIEVKNLFDKEMLNKLSSENLQKIIDNFNVQVINKYFGQYITRYGIDYNSNAITKLILPRHIKNNITNCIEEYQEFTANPIACIYRKDVNARLQAQEDEIEKLKSSNQELQDVQEKVKYLEEVVKKLIETTSISENNQEITNSSKAKNKM